MAPILTHQSIYVGGWFGLDGESEPTDGAFTDGWYGGEENLAQLSDRLSRLEALLISHKPLFINNNGQFQELDISTG